MPVSDRGANWLLYDGDCPFCSRYVRYMRLREAVGTLTLENARSRGDLVAEVQERGYDVNRGMVLKLDGRYYHGADCINTLAWLTTSSGTFNRVNRALFKSRMLSRLLYPVLRACRNVTLALLGRARLSESHLQ